MLGPEPGADRTKTLINASYDYTSVLFDLFTGSPYLYNIYKDQKYPLRSKTTLNNIAGNFLKVTF